MSYKQSSQDKELLALLDSYTRLSKGGDGCEELREQINAKALEILETMTPVEVLAFVSGVRSTAWRRQLAGDMSRN